MARKDKIEKLLEALVAGQNTKEQGLVPSKLMNVLVMGALGAVGALIWSTTTTLPLQNADTFSLIQQQNAEIKTTVLEMKTSLGALTTKLDQNQRQTADQQARITGLETNAQANRDNIVQLSDRVSQLEHKDRGR